MFWGLTPALDLISHYKSLKSAIPDELNILIIGGADARHILLTLARRYRHEKVKLNFFVIEACCETIAKQLLLLYIALQHENDLGLVQKTRIFMELYGNSLLRPATAKYLHFIAANFVKMITNYDWLNEIMPFISLDLKYKDRDYLENLFKFWCSQDEFNILESWDKRLRKTLGIRYDNKLGAFDWDLHMRLHPMGGKTVCNQEYRSWRLNGLAFSFLESEVSKTNRSMVSGVVQNGDKFYHYGYLGDIETGPFVTYGLECEDESFLKRANGQNTHRATDIIERNLKQIFYEIQFQDSYEHLILSDAQLGSVVTAFSEVKVVDVKSSGEVPKKECKKCVSLDDVSIKFSSLNNLNYMQYNSVYKNCFDFIYFGCTYVKYMQKGLVEHVAKNDAVMLVENQKFVLSHRKEQLTEFGKSISEKTDKMECEILPFDVQNDNFAEFLLKTK